MPVRQAEDHSLVHPTHVYIIPPNSVLTLEHGQLRVVRSAEAGLRTPIDAFLRSLARDQGERAIGIIFSGAGSDGTSGLRAIKEHGGLTLAQSPETAKYDSMPQSAIAAGLVDFALSVGEMPARILAYAHRVAELQREASDDLDEQVKSQLAPICQILQRQTGHDFGHYKQGTLLRRIRRRIQLIQSNTVSDYVTYLDHEPAEAEFLHRDLLIGVTQFFRDPEVFAFVAAAVIPTIVGRGSSAPIRIWVPGCASGEEAYSFAILVREHLSRTATTHSVQIFATDIDGELLATGRLGRYSQRIAEQVSAERLERFFVQEGDTYQVTKEIREMCTFSEHSLIRDPPFSSLDLISCRNVLIYLGAELQKKLVPLFHYALRPAGFLLLGPSESLAAHPELFTTVDKMNRLFRRNEAAVRPPLEFPLAGHGPSKRQPSRVDLEGEPITPQVFSQAFERMILEEYAPPSAVTNEQGDILYLAGRAGRYLQVAAGAPTNNIFDLARGALRIELRNVLGKAVLSQRKVVLSNLAVELDGDVMRLRLTARPLPGMPAESGLYAVVLQNIGSPAESDGEQEAPGTPGQPIIEQLENELRTTRASLQYAMQDLESANEELKSSNEELISTNEELQSANEELQTSKEELQSANDELRTKVLELDAANSELQYHFAGTKIITVFLDRELRIVRSTPGASKLFNVLGSDLGRPFRDLAPRFVEDDLMDDIEVVLRTGSGLERKVYRSDDSAWFLMRILPYRTTEGTIAGIGVTFVDIGDLLRAEEAERRYGRLLLLSPDPIFVWRLDGGIETWNHAAEELYGFGLNEAMGQEPRELLGQRWPGPWSEIESALRERGRWEGELESRTKDGRALVVSAKLAPLRGEDGVARVLQSDRDVTGHKSDLAEREGLISELRAQEQRKNEFLAMLSHELRNPLAPVSYSLAILERVPPGSEQARHAVAVIERQVAQLSRIVDDLLEVTRISRGKLQVQRLRIELGDLVQRTVDDHRSMFADAGLVLNVQIAERPMWVDGDAARLAQAIGNLLSNAVKFTGRGGHVFVALAEDSTRNSAVIRVRDDGPGIDPDLLERVFEPFTQADRTLDRSRGGLGLGLALTKGLVEQHGGELLARSDGAGKGAEFAIRLPLAGAPPGVRSSAVTLPLPRPLRILVIEDNVDAAESLRVMLRLAGHQAEVAYDGSEGLRKARELKPDVVLCDIGLPGIGGYEVARAMRADSELRSIRLVALTGYALPEDRLKSQDAGFEYHLAKPPSFEQIEEVLGGLAQRQRA